jgi:hypothetical protein
MTPARVPLFGHRRLASTGQLTLRFFVALALANAPFWLLSTTMFMSRGFFNVDVALAFCLMPFAPRAAVVLLCTLWGADWILSQSLLFHFRTPSEFVHAFRYANELDPLAYINLQSGVIALLFIASAAALIYITKGQRRLWRPGIVVSASLVLLDAMNGSSMLSDRSGWRFAFNLAGSPTTTLAAHALGNQTAAQLHPLGTEDTIQGVVDIPLWARSHPERSVLFVIAESLGVPTSPEFHSWLKAQLVDPKIESQFDVHTAEVPFRGSTTSGELRSLCALAGSYRSMSAKSGENCLPARLVQEGWSTVGIHGFSGRMFNRTRWWPAIGLQSTLFIDAPEFKEGPRCGAAFRGGCDHDLIDIGTHALSPAKRFVYLLTLNTHLPVAPSSATAPVPAQCQLPDADSDVCGHLAATGQMLRHLREAVGTVVAKPLVVVVGDHAPPFANKQSRQAYLQDKVPAFVLVPRE